MQRMENFPVLAFAFELPRFIRVFPCVVICICVARVNQAQEQTRSYYKELDAEFKTVIYFFLELSQVKGYRVSQNNSLGGRWVVTPIFFLFSFATRVFPVFFHFLFLGLFSVLTQYQSASIKFYPSFFLTSQGRGWGERNMKTRKKGVIIERGIWGGGGVTEGQLLFEEIGALQLNSYAITVVVV